MSHYGLRCRKCSKLLADSYCAFCEHCRDALLVSDYGGARFSQEGGAGIWRFNWLPVHAPSFVQPGPSVYRSRGLAMHLGLENLHVAFNGYWPEKGALPRDLHLQGVRSLGGAAERAGERHRGADGRLGGKHGPFFRLPLGADRLPGGHRGAGDVPDRDVVSRASEGRPDRGGRRWRLLRLDRCRPAGRGDPRIPVRRRRQERCQARRARSGAARGGGRARASSRPLLPGRGQRHGGNRRLGDERALPRRRAIRRPGSPCCTWRRTCRLPR